MIANYNYKLPLFNGPERFRSRKNELRIASVLRHLNLAKQLTGESYRPMNIPAGAFSAKSEIRASEVLSVLA
jgi:hypothetical protein